MAVDQARQDCADADERRGILAALVDRYSRPLSRYFARRVAAHQDVPDLVQEVFLRLSRMDSPDNIRHHESFIFVTASNVLKDRFRGPQSKMAALSDPIDDLPLEGSDFAPDRVFESKQAAVLVRRALMELPERTRDIFVLRMMEGMKIADIAQAMHVSSRAVEKHQARALAHVAARLKEWQLD